MRSLLPGQITTHGRTYDEILTWVCAWLFSRAGPAAPQRLYLEVAVRRPQPVLDAAAEYMAGSLLGTSRFKKELFQLPESWDHTLGEVAFQAKHAKGGRFAAWECPQELVADLRSMFGKDGGAYGCVAGNNGYVR